MAHRLRGEKGRFVTAEKWLETPRTPQEIMEANIPMERLQNYYDKLRRELKHGFDSVKRQGLTVPDMPVFPSETLKPSSKIGDARALAHALSAAQGVQQSGMADPSRVQAMRENIIANFDAKVGNLTNKLFSVLDKKYTNKKERNRAIGSERIPRMAQQLVERNINPEKILSDPDAIEKLSDSLDEFEDAPEIRPKVGQWKSDAYLDYLGILED